MRKFISEDDVETFEGWLRYQGFDAATLAPDDDLAEWRELFDKVRKDSLATPKVGLMKLPRIPGEHRYAVAVRDGSDLWLTLWVKRSKKGEFFVMVPRKDPLRFLPAALRLEIEDLRRNVAVQRICTSESMVLCIGSRPTRSGIC